ncbi:MAG: class IV adenylate cyclase [Solirubrobacteraceae bacterium]
MRRLDQSGEEEMPDGGAALRNLELKVRLGRDEDADAARARAVEAFGAGFEELRQIDAYFVVAHGRLKVRRIDGPGDLSSAELIAYSRPDESGPRWSAYRRVPIPAGEVAAFLAALEATCGALAVVRKRRSVAVVERTRIHIDRVEALGAFVELETVATGAAADDGAAGEESARIARALGLDAFEVVAGSYSDMMTADAGRTPSGG